MSVASRSCLRCSSDRRNRALDCRSLAAATGPDGRHTMYPIDGGEPRPISGLSNRDRPVRFNADGRHLFVFSRDKHGAQKLERFEVATGRRTPWPFPAADMAGIVSFGPAEITADGDTALYYYHRVLDDLYVVSGLQ
jgi:hypothetical protein